MTELYGQDPTQQNPSDLDGRGSLDGEQGSELTVDRGMTAASHALSSGRSSFPTVEGYEILEVLGRGGMGVVYKARQVGLKRIVAIKMILAGGHAGEMHLSRFRAEAESAARLQHPNIVLVYEVGESGGFPFFSQEFVEGGTLAQRLQGAPQPARPAAELMVLLADAIDYAHQKGVVHRDLKPANILLTTQGVAPREEASGVSPSHSTTPCTASGGSNALSAAQAFRYGIPKIADFGLAKQLDDQSGRTESGSIIGTPSYMAPEQASGKTHEIGPTADTYALGAILYELLTGRPPFRGESSLETLEQVRTQEPVRPRQLQPKLPPDLETICLKCLRKERTQRYATAGDLAADLRAFLQGRPIAARPAGAFERGWRWCHRQPWTAAFIGASVVVVLALMVGGWYRQQFLQSQRLAKASEEVAQAQSYFSLVNSARELAAVRPQGWTWRALDDLDTAAKAPSHIVDRVQLRGLAADCLTRFDLRDPHVLAEGLTPSALAFSPDGKRLAIAERKNSLTLSVVVYDAATRQRVATHSISTVGSSLERLMQGTGSFQEGIGSLAYSPDGKWLVVGTRFGKLYRWDQSQRDPHAVAWQAHGNKECINSLTFTPDGNGLISASDGLGLRLWRISAEWKESVLLPDVERITEVKYAGPDVLVIASQNRLQLYLSDSLRPLVLQPAEVFAWRFAISPDGRTIALKGADCIQLLSTHGRRAPRALTLPEDDSLVSGTTSEILHFSPDGALLASPWADRRIRVWDVASGRIVATLAIPGDENPIPAFSPDGCYLAVSGEKQTLLYELRPTEYLTTLGHQLSSVQAFDFTPGGQGLVTSAERGFPDRVTDNSVCWWNATNGELQHESCVEGYRGKARVEFSPVPNSVAVHPQGTFAATNTALLGTRLVSDAEPYERSRMAELPDVVPVIELAETELVPSPAVSDAEVRPDHGAVDGMAIRISTGPSRREVLATVPTIYRKNIAATIAWAVYASVRVESSGKSGPAFELSVITGPTRNTTVVELTSLANENYHWHLVGQFTGTNLEENPDLRFSVGVSENAEDVKNVWVDRFAFVPLKARSWPDNVQVFPQGPLAFSASGNRLWGVLDEGQVVSWNVPEMTLETRWNVTTASQALGKFSIRPLSAGDRWVVVGSNSGDAFVLSAATGKMEQTWRDRGRSIRALTLDSSENFAAIGTDNGSIRLVRVPSGEPFETLSGHGESVESLVLSPDGQLLVSGSHDRTVRIWRNNERGFEHLITLPVSGRVRAVRLAPGGKKLAVLAENERAVRVWHLDRLYERLESMGLNW